MKRLLAAVATVATGAMMCGGVAAANADTTVTVTPADIAAGTDWFTGDTRVGAGSTATGATGLFTFGPATPPFGAGSFELGTPTSNAKVQLLTDLYSGTPLAAIQGIGYSTYQNTAPAPTVAMAAINVRVDLNGDTMPDAYLVYEPYQDLGNAAIQNGVWQNWDAYRGGAAKWWISSGAGGCGQATPCTWNQILSLFPAAGVRDGASCGNATYPKAICPGSLGFNQGSGNQNTSSNADALYVTVGGNKTTYNFEPAADSAKPVCGSLVVRPGGNSADVTISDSGSGIASITNFQVENGTYEIPPFTPGGSSLTVTAHKTVQGELTRFSFDVTDLAGNTIHCV